MEGPSLTLAAQQLQPFIHKKVLKASGLYFGKERFLNEEVLDIFSWGKHLVFQFHREALRSHFMIGGTYEAEVEGQLCKGDYDKRGEPMLLFEFENGYIGMYANSLKPIESTDAKSIYDFSVDIMSDQFDDQQAFKLVRKYPKHMIMDELLNQKIFSGVGNIIKNEVLFMTQIHPETLNGDLSDDQINRIIQVTKAFCQQFYEWRKTDSLRKNLQIYKRSTCPICSSKVVHKYLGKTKRSTYYCPKDQILPQN